MKEYSVGYCKQPFARFTMLAQHMSFKYAIFAYGKKPFSSAEGLLI